MKRHIDFRLNCIVNSFFKVSDIKPAIGDLRIIQLASNTLLRRFKEICDCHNITYWLDYGTLLGACRNGGFIPWDDDIDIGMMRLDFEKLERVLYHNSDFRLSEWLHLNNEYDVHCRVKKFMFADKNCNLFIDIFCYDFCSCKDKDIFYDEYINLKNQLRSDLAKLNMSKYSFCPCENSSDLNIINKVFKKYSPPKRW